MKLPNTKFTRYWFGFDEEGKDIGGLIPGWSAKMWIHTMLYVVIFGPLNALLFESCTFAFILVIIGVLIFLSYLIYVLFFEDNVEKSKTKGNSRNF